MGLDDNYFDLEIIFWEFSKEMAIMMKNKLENIEKYSIFEIEDKLISKIFGDIILNLKSMTEIIKNINKG